MSFKFAFEIFRELTRELSSKRRLVRVQVIALMASFIGVVLVVMSTFFVERPALQNKDYQQQIKSLNETERSLKQLVTFIETQKAKLAESEAVVKSLKEEESKLRPVVEADRKLVDAILDAQHSRSRAYIWKERIISFLLGIIASIVAALLLTAINKARRTRISEMETS